MADPTILCVADAKCELGEGPVWDERQGVLYWTDILGRALWRLDPATGEASWLECPVRVGSFALREAADGFIAATEDGFHFVDPRRASSASSTISCPTIPIRAATTGNAIRPAASGPARWT